MTFFPVKVFVLAAVFALGFAARADQKIIANPTAGTRDKPDARFCGMLGCVQNSDGTYSPGKYAPDGAFSSSEDDSGPVRSVIDYSQSFDKYSPRGCMLGCVYDPDKKVWNPIHRQRQSGAKATDATAPGHESKGCKYSGTRVVPIKGVVTCVAFMKCEGESGPGLCNLSGNGCPQDANTCANDQDRPVGKDTMDEAGIFKSLCLDPKTQAPQQGCKPAGKRGDSGFVGEPDDGKNGTPAATPAGGNASSGDGTGNGSASKGD